MISKYKIAVLCAGIILVLASVASALDVGVESKDVRISSREGTVYVWATNPTNEEATLTFNARLGILQGSFDETVLAVAPKSTAGTVLRINAPDCTRGVQDVKIEAKIEAIEAAGYNDSGAAFVRVTIVPNEACDAYNEASPSSEAYPHKFERYQSTVTYGTYYDPSEYNLDVKTTDLKCAVGDASKAKIVLVNKGAAAALDLRLVGDVAGTGAVVYPKNVVIQRSEVLEVGLYAAPREVGKKKLVLQVLRNNAIVLERSVFIEAIPPKLESSNASISETKGIVEQGVVKVVAKIKNPYDTVISNVTAEIINLPKEWTYTTSVPSEIPANGEANVTAEVRGNVGEEARNAVLVVKSNGQVIAEQKLPVLTIEPGVLTGFFTFGIGRNVLWVVVVLAVAAAAAYAYLKAGGEFPEIKIPGMPIGSLFGGETVYKKRLRKIRAQIESIAGAERIPVLKTEA